MKYNFDRYISTVNTSTSRSWLVYVVGEAKNVTVVDPLTVKFVAEGARSPGSRRCSRTRRA